MTKKDFNECAKLITQEFNKQGDEFTLKTAKNRIENVFDKRFAFCALENKKIVGMIIANHFLYAKGNYVWIDELVVAKEHQGKGIGTTLLKKVEESATKNKIDVIAFNSRPQNFDFYQKFGYNKTDYVMFEKDLKKK